MGTRFELVIHGEECESLRPAAEAAIEEINASHRRLSRFESTGLIAHLQRSRAPVELDADTWDLFVDALLVWRASGGAFDLTLPARRMEAILLDPRARTVRLADGTVPLDFGAIAKGHALDLAARVLRDAGVTAAFLQGGTSSAIGLGVSPTGTGWRVALGPGREAPTIVLDDAALSVSALWNGNPHPTLDPRSGTAMTGRRRVAIVGPSSRLADAWSTAILVSGHRPQILSTAWRVHVSETSSQAGVC